MAKRKKSNLHEEAMQRISGASERAHHEHMEQAKKNVRSSSAAVRTKPTKENKTVHDQAQQRIQNAAEVARRRAGR